METEETEENGLHLQIISFFEDISFWTEGCQFKSHMARQER